MIRSNLPPFRVMMLLGCGALLYFFANFQRVAIPGALFNELQRDFSLRAAAVTGLGSVFMYIYAAAQLAVGFWVDRYGGRRVLAAGAVVFGIGGVLFPLCSSVEALYCCRMLTGLGAATFYLSLMREIARSFPRNCSFVLALLIVIGFAGAIAANAPFTHCVEHIGWRGALLGAGIAAAVIGALSLPLLSRADAPTTAPPAPFARWRAILADPRNRHLFLFSSLNFGLFYVVQTVIGKKFLMDCGGLGTVAAGWVMSLLGTLAAGSGIFCAWLYRRCGDRPRRLFLAAAGNAALLFLLMIAALAAGARGSWYALGLCALAPFAALSPVLVSYLKDHNPPEQLAMVVGLMNFCNYLVIAVLGNLSGVILDRFPAAEAANGDRVYPAAAYLALLGLLFGCALIEGAAAHRLTAPAGCRSGTAPRRDA